MQTIVISPFNPKLVISLMMTTAYISEQTSLHFEGAMGAVNKCPIKPSAAEKEEGCRRASLFL